MILVDFREPSRIVEEIKKTGIEVSVENLPVSDYVVGKFIIERKTVPDLFTSTYGKRIFKQLFRLRDAAISGELIPILAVIGTLPPKSEWRRIGSRPIEIMLSPEEKDRKESLAISSINTTLISFKTSVMFFPKERQFVKWIADLHYRQTEHTPKKPVVSKKSSSNDPEEILYNVLTCFGGIGAKRAGKIVESNISLEELFRKSIDDPKSLKGLLRDDSIQNIKRVFSYKKKKDLKDPDHGQEELDRKE